MENYLKRLVSYYPVSSNQGSVLELLEYVKKHMDKHGLKTEILSYNGVHSLYASSNGTKHAKLLLQGHIDVVPADSQSFRADSESYYGRGVYDMLYATACYMKLLDDLQGDIGKMDIGFMLSGDEELGGTNSVEPFLEDGYSTELCVLPDAGQGFGTLNVAAKGIYHCTIRINGRAHHGSRPWEGDGAAIKLVHFLTELEQCFDVSSQDNTTMTVAKLKAGEADNQGPAYSETTLDIRYSNKADLKTVQQKLDKLLNRFEGEIVTVHEGDDYQLDVSHPDVAKFIHLYEKYASKPIKHVKAHGSSDARFFAKKGVPVIMLRPDGGGAHGDNEWISKESVEKFYQLLKEYVTTIAYNGDSND
jgi:acetylornithine deacetylase/succinyl-diaminopimelate desuccinylase-like protein